MKKFLTIFFVQILILFSLSPASANFPSRWQGESNISPNFAREVLALVNSERAKVGAQPLRISQDLMRSANVRAEELPEKFSHTRPDGSSCFTAIKSSYSIIGENIAAGQSSPASVVESWMNSEGHRENILNKRFRFLGVGYFNAPNGEYKHYWVQLFKG